MARVDANLAKVFFVRNSLVRKWHCRRLRGQKSAIASPVSAVFADAPSPLTKRSVDPFQCRRSGAEFSGGKRVQGLLDGTELFV